MTGERSGSQNRGGREGRGRRRRRPSSSVEEVERQSLPRGGQGTRDESTVSRQTVGGALGGLAASRWREASSRDTGRSGGGDGDDGRGARSRKRRRRPSDDVLTENTRGARLAREGADLVKDEFGQTVDIVPRGGSSSHTNFYANMPQSTGMVAGKFEPGTRKGEETRRHAEQAALRASSTGQVMFLYAPTQATYSTGGHLGMGNVPRSASMTSKPFVPYSSRKRVKAATKCGNCDKASHKTGACPKASRRHGDTAVCPICNVTPDAHTLDSETSAEAEAEAEAEVGDRLQLARTAGCPMLIQARLRLQLRQIFNLLVVDRVRRPALRVRDGRNCFLKVVFEWADLEFGGRMPPDMGGRWPYTKDDAIRFREELERFDEVGVDRMPPSSLEGMTFAEVRAAYERGDIRPQVYRAEEHVAAQARAARHAAPEGPRDLSDEIDAMAREMPVGVTGRPLAKKAPAKEAPAKEAPVKEPPAEEVPAREAPQGAAGGGDDGSAQDVRMTDAGDERAGQMLVRAREGPTADEEDLIDYSDDEPERLAASPPRSPVTALPLRTPADASGEGMVRSWSDVAFGMRAAWRRALVRADLLSTDRPS